MSLRSLKGLKLARQRLRCLGFDHVKAIAGDLPKSADVRNSYSALHIAVNLESTGCALLGSNRNTCSQLTSDTPHWHGSTAETGSCPTHPARSTLMDAWMHWALQILSNEFTNRRHLADAGTDFAATRTMLENYSCTGSSPKICVFTA